MSTSFTKLSIIIPCYNEERTVHLILDKVVNVKLTDNINKELIIVNDCSKDKTKEAIERYFSQKPGADYKLYNHEINKGKGSAIHTGISKATGRDHLCSYRPAERWSAADPFQRRNS